MPRTKSSARFRGQPDLFAAVIASKPLVSPSPPRVTAPAKRRRSPDPPPPVKRARTRGQLRALAEESTHRRVTVPSPVWSAQESLSSEPAPSPTVRNSSPPVSLCDSESVSDAISEQWNWKFPSAETLDVSLMRFIKGKNKLPYDPLDPRSKYRYELSRIEAANPSQSEPLSSPLSERFLNSDSEARYVKYRKRTLWPERYVPLVSETKSLMKIISNSGLDDTVLVTESFVKDIVLEFYANFPVSGSESKNRRVVVFVRGKMFEFSARLINQVFGTTDRKFKAGSELNIKVTDNSLARFLTGDRVQHWRDVRPKLLTTAMARVFGICCLNWMPSTNNTHLTKDRARLLYMLAKRMPFNFGKLVFDQIHQVALHPVAVSSGSDKTIPFPSLIYQVLQYQREVPVYSHEVPELIKPYKSVPKSGMGRRQHPVPGHVYGVNLEADLRKQAQLLLDIADRVAGGEYTSLAQDQAADADVEAELEDGFDDDIDIEAEESRSQEF